LKELEELGEFIQLAGGSIHGLGDQPMAWGINPKSWGINPFFFLAFSLASHAASYSSVAIESTCFSNQVMINIPTTQ
jgi:hypothetical protein